MDPAGVVQPLKLTGTGSAVVSTTIRVAAAISIFNTEVADGVVPGLNATSML
ncbi:hypothetical protein [Dokdonella soli]|uniref:hypothetical protein n=1 Tax=Dokdonella soli TaxID=529810 RepID=UPI0031D967D2